MAAARKDRGDIVRLLLEKEKTVVVRSVMPEYFFLLTLMMYIGF